MWSQTFSPEVPVSLNWQILYLWFYEFINTISLPLLFPVPLHLHSAHPIYSIFIQKGAGLPYKTIKIDTSIKFQYD